MGFSHAYGVATERAEAVRTMREAFDMGYTMFDTAECYTGVFTDGGVSYNEELVGEACTMCATRCRLLRSSACITKAVLW